MAQDWRSGLTHHLEERCIAWMNLIEPGAVRNNAGERLSDVDILWRGEKVDFQFSGNFAKWGDFRADLVSCYTDGPTDPAGTSMLTATIAREADDPQCPSLTHLLSRHIRIKKFGKIGQTGPEAPDRLVIFFYNGQAARTGQPDLIYSAGITELRHFIAGNWRHLAQSRRILFNHKSALGD